MQGKIKKIIIFGILFSVISASLFVVGISAVISNLVTGNASEEEGITDEEIIEGEEGEYNGGQFTWPAPGVTYISSEYGWRSCPYHGREFHSGIDIAGAAGNAIVAAEAGKVVLSGWHGGYGNCVIISHGSNLYSLYGHLLSKNVSVGQKVKAGKQIGRLGSTGNSTGPHLHFEVRSGSSLYSPHVSPWKYLKK